MAEQMHVLAPTGYPWAFNGPRASRHLVERRSFIPFNKVSAKIEGFTVFKPLPARRFDLIHAFNRIPLGADPFIIGFESHLPRAYGLEKTAYYSWLVRMLEDPRCRGIFPISEHAKTIFEHFLADRPERDALLQKTQVRYPNISLSPEADTHTIAPNHLRVAFVGAHFARKGGCVAVRLAELARERGAPISVDIVSKLEMGAAVWTDPIRDSYFDRYRALLDAPNVKLHGPLGNPEVLALLGQAHFSLLATFGDTFGFSAIESMARGTPVVATTQGALPEFIKDADSGILLPLDTNDLGEWRYAAAATRNSMSFENMFTSQVERLAQAAFDRLVYFLDRPAAYRAMRVSALAATHEFFDSDVANTFWDSTYDNAVKR